MTSTLSFQVQIWHMLSKETLIDYFKKAIDEKDSNLEIYLARSILVWISYMLPWTMVEKLFLPEEIQMLLQDKTLAFKELCE